MFAPHVGDDAHILFTPNLLPRLTMNLDTNKNCIVTLDNLYPLETWPHIFANRSIMLRVDPGSGRGHHRHVVTAGNGISNLVCLLKTFLSYGIFVIDIILKLSVCMRHAGSGIRDG